VFFYTDVSLGEWCDSSPTLGQIKLHAGN